MHTYSFTILPSPLTLKIPLLNHALTLELNIILPLLTLHSTGGWDSDWTISAKLSYLMCVPAMNHHEWILLAVCFNAVWIFYPQTSRKWLTQSPWGRVTSTGG